MKKIINLNPRVIEEYKNNKKINIIMLRVGLLLVAILLIASYPIKYINKILENNIKSISKEVEKNNEAVSNNIVLKREKKELELIIESIINISETRRNTSNIIAEINKYIPPSLKFLEFSFDENGLIKIKGETINYNSIPEFLANLEMSEDFINVRLEEIITKKNNAIVEKKPLEKKHDVPENIIEAKTLYDFSILLEEVNTYEEKER